MIDFVATEVPTRLQPCPINPDWIREGEPQAWVTELSRSHDGMASTLAWDCTPGKFEWFYQDDETVHVVHGVVCLDEGKKTERRIGPGDVVFFPAGSTASWHVQTPFRKIAFARRSMPSWFMKLRALKHWLYAIKRSSSNQSQDMIFGGVRKPG